MIQASEELEAALQACAEVRSSDVPITVDSKSGATTVYRYQDVAGTLRNHDIFSNSPPGAPHENQHAMLFTDPPRHRELRGLVSKAFTPRVVAQLESRLGQLAEMLIGEVQASGTADVIAAISDPLPMIMIAEMLGIDSTTTREFKRWSNAFSVVAVSQSHSQDNLAPHLAALSEMFDYLEEIIAARRKHPRDDLVTALVQAEDSGQRLTEDELKATCAQLLAAGDETTTNFIGNAVICLTERWELAEKLRGDLGLVPSFLEEVLRFASPVQYVPRYVKEEVKLHGHQLGPGTPVFAHIGSANNDEAQFDSPRTFDIERDTTRHLAFGFGPHFCLGASLARLEAKVAIEGMLTHLKGRWEIPHSTARLVDRPFFFGVERLPLEWHPT